MDTERIDPNADDAPPPPPGDLTEAGDAVEPEIGPEPETAVLPEPAVEPETAVLPAPIAEETVVFADAPAIEPAAPAAEYDEPEERHGMRRGTKVAIGLGAFLAVLAGAYGVTAWYIQDKIPNNTFVGDVAIGGLTAPEATAKVAAGFASRPEETVTVTAQERSTELTAAELGLAIDAEATVAPLVGVSLNPVDMWNHFVGLGHIDPVATIDPDVAEAGLVSVLPSLEVEPVEGAIALDGGEAVVTDAVEAIRVDIPASIEILKAEWLDAAGPIELTTVTTEPDISQADVDAAMAQIVEPLLSGPVTVTDGETSSTLSPSDLTRAAEIVPENGSLTLAVDGEALHETITEGENVFEVKGKDARIVIKNGAPTIVPSTTGLTIDDEQLATAVAAAAVSADSREAAIELVEAEPEFNTAAAEKLGVKEEVAIFSTPLTADSTRTHNLITGSEKISNTLVKPGETFSLIDALGPVTAERGFVNNGVVENGFVTTAMGGGLSQISTTTYNAAYFAGMDIVAHKPHSRWFSRYPEGREATIWSPDLDMKWKNSSPYGVLVQAWVADGKQWVRIWSTKYYKVDTYTSPRYAIVSPGVKYNSAANCVPERAGQPGFSVDGWRKRYVDGSLDETFNWSWTYQPWHEVRCGTQAEWEARQNASSED